MAYTKYSLTPANNNAAPPDGAPEGMLPSAVNDTMRDMMAQIRDVGDGIRGGTYTMTAPVITGGSITGVALSGNTLTNPVITGGSINNTPIGASTANTGAFTTLGATGVATFSAGTVSAPAITTTGDTNTGIFFPAADTIAFTEGGVESMRITSAGRLGIGTTAPSELLDSRGAAVFSGDNATGTNAFGTASGILLSTASDNSVARVTAVSNGNNNVGLSLRSLSSGSAVEGIRIDSSGNVGIGTSSPATKLDVTGQGRFAAADANAQIKLERTGTAAGSGWIGANSTANFMVLGPAFDERMRIDSSGNVLVGATSLTNNEKVSVVTGNTTGMVIKSTGGATYAPIYAWNATTTGDGYFAAFFTETTASFRGSITYNRGAGLVAYNVNSDYRAKTIDSPIENALNDIILIKTHKATMNGAKISMPMFVAHELAEVAPYCVTGEKDAVDEEGKAKYQQVDSSPLIPLLVKAIQEQQALIENLTTRLNALEGK
jgi:hypothetical protein